MNQSANGCWPTEKLIFFKWPTACSMGVPRLRRRRHEVRKNVFLAFGPMEGKFFAVIWTWRDGTHTNCHSKENQRCGRKAIPCVFWLKRLKPRLSVAKIAPIGAKPK